MKISIAQLNPTIGDIQGNLEKVKKSYQAAVESGADLLVCPEMVLTGYPPRDLLLKPKFVEDNLLALLFDPILFPHLPLFGLIALSLD